MTQRYKAVLVTLADDVREDDAEPILAALRMVRGVLAADPVPADIEGHVAQRRVRTELAEKLWNVLYPKGACPP